jgi:hypothetical protein
VFKYVVSAILYASPSISRVIKLRAKHAAHTAEMRDAYEILVGKSEGKKSLERQRHRGKIILERILGK